MNKPDCANCSGLDALICPCNNMVKYNAFLESKRIFSKGNPITSLDEFSKQEWVFIYGKPRHMGFAHSQQFRTILNSIKTGCIFYAIRKEVK